MTQPTDIAHRYLAVLSPEDRDRLPFYDALTRTLADNDDAVRILASAPPRQQNPTLILAIIHYLALSGHEVLGPLYQSVREGRITDWATAAATVSEVVSRDAILIEQQLHRSTQTNEPNRSAVLSRVIADTAHRKSWDRITLIDVGCSMGLNLYPDLVSVSDRDTGDPALLVTTNRSRDFMSSPMPEITRRVGIDLNPLSPRDADDVAWLEACIWPEEPRRFARFAALVEQTATWPTPEVIQGHATTVLNQLLGEIDGPVIMMNSWVLWYLSAEEQIEFRTMTNRWMAKRNDLAWICVEHPWIFSNLDLPPMKAPHDSAGATAIVVTTTDEGSTSWGWCHPHGHWFEALSGPKA